MLLKSRRAIVTSGASGQAVAEEAGPEVAYFHCDVSKRAEVLETFARCVEWSSQFHSAGG